MTALAQIQLPLRPAGPATVADLLAWYDAEKRDLPWRHPVSQTGRGKPDPYRVWLSEIMLQQTTVKAVIPYYVAFLARWPTVKDLARADPEDVLAAWAGLGYYSRARNLIACAATIATEHGGRFPASEAELLRLPGIGPYTAAAVAAIAFGLPATPVDGNIERVTSRLFAVKTPLPAAKPEIKRLAATLTPTTRPGDFAQAMMDLGATICMPRTPSCLMCPVQRDCHGYHLGLAATLPRRSPRAAKPVRYGTAFLAQREDGAILLRKRPDKGLLAAMMEVPSTPWVVPSDPTPVSADDKARDTLLRSAPVKGNWIAMPGSVTHTFTHFKLVLTVYRAVVRKNSAPLLWASPERCRWVHASDLKSAALPSVMRKIITHGMEEA